LAKRGLHELEVVVSCLESLGTKLKVPAVVASLYVVYGDSCAGAINAASTELRLYL